ncbi:hypothetical protein P691DRAFT_785043 [Macrolepiota fuliginosa MF-IS2]|uniref:Uncharacterized protein n=1 Tax=Macrolepiota fuliginosa MF-IS2 TaxID=1400762 RepID=A0A9P5X6T6_9AGAR|nr:hypothetical protein P691DRAFT_785043 [Macrolepiota fuliginosa MF-IS2]
MFCLVYLLFSSLWTFFCRLFTPWKWTSTNCVASSSSPMVIDIEVGVEVTQVVDLPAYLHSRGSSILGTPEVSDRFNFTTNGEPYFLNDAMGCHGTAAASNGSICDEADRASSRDSIHSTSTDMTSSSQDTFFEEHSFESVTSLDGPSDEGIRKCSMDSIVLERAVADHLVSESRARENITLGNKIEDVNVDRETEPLETGFNKERGDASPTISKYFISLIRT